jgi:hypothetical protein
MTKQTEALRLAIKNMEQCNMGITILLEGLAKFGVPKDILRLDKESILVPAIKACKEALAEDILPPIEQDNHMGRTYIPIAGGWEIQTKGRGSSFRICDTKTGNRFIIGDRFLHTMLETLARENREAMK